MNDFNTDNLRIDTGVSSLNGAIAAHAAATTPHMSVQDRFSLQAAGEHIAAAALHLSAQDRTNFNAAHAHIAATAPHISAQERTNIAAAVSHIASGTLHLTQAQRDRIASSLRWNVHTYTGNGTLTRSINIGYRPLFGIVCGLGVPMFETNMFDHTLRQYAAVFTRHGSSQHVTLENSGIGVRNSPNGDHLGNGLVLNMNGTTYVIIAARDD